MPPNEDPSTPRRRSKRAYKPRLRPSNHFSVNGIPRCSLSAGYELKCRYGRQAVLVKLPAASASAASSPTAAESTALLAENMTLPLARCTICAVDAHGRFHTEDGGAYILAAARDEEEMSNLVKAERSICAALRNAVPRKNPCKTRPPTLRERFTGAVRATFSGVSVGDANRAWSSIPMSVRKTKELEAMIDYLKGTGLYTVRGDVPEL